jgi:uncharacterized Zn finger protein (UPF0148 family)
VVTSCPFCGATASLPHESQEACIAALQEEIARTREIANRLKAQPDFVSGDDPTSETEPEPGR